MGLRSASVRRSQVVMAPALTETTQSQSFKLAPKNHFQLVTPINNFEQNSTYCLTKHGDYYENDENNGRKKLNAKGNGFAIFDYTESKKTIDLRNSDISKKASDIYIKESPNIMNNSLPSMGDQEDKMGLQKMGLESVEMVHKGKNVSTDVEQLLNNLNSELPANDCSGGEIPTNVDEIMQVITSMEGGNERLASVSTSDEDFPISAGDLARDLATSLLSFEKQLLNDVDMMNISIEDQQECETVESIKETRSKELILEAQKKQVEVQRRLDFLRRRVLKLQSRLMGQHVSGEVVGVFEHVHRSLKRLKDSAVQDNMHPMEITSTPGSSLPLPLTGCNDLDKFKPLSYASAKTLVRKLETSTVIQANSAARQKQVPKYFGSGSIEPATFRTSVSGLVAIPPWSPEHKQELQKVSGTLKSELRIIQSEVDSEATDSSSGGESCDEFQNYNNQHQQYLGIQKRALWKYSTERAAIAARWTWLQVQISDLEYRIRQHSELHRQIRTGKGSVLLEGTNPPSPSSVPSSPTALNGYRGQLPGASSAGGVEAIPCASKTQDIDGVYSAAEFQCARTRPLVSFRKRKLLQTGGLHVISKKAARPSTVRCGCAVPAVHCALCTGRADPTHPRDPPEVLSAAEKIALLDPSFHPVFSMTDDVSESIHLEAIMKMPEWQQRISRMKSLKGYTKGERLDKTPLDHRTKKLEHRKKYGRLLKPSTISALSAKIKNKIRGRKASRHLNRLTRKRMSSSLRSSHHQSSDGLDDEVESISNNSSAVPRSAGESPSSSPLLQMQSISGLSRKNRISSYDIDNIVIPYSVAAATRVEKLQYKEILTPKWRIADSACTKYENKSNGVINLPEEEESDNEDLSEEATIARHDKCELDERKKFLSYLKLPIGYGRARAQKRTDSRAESSDTNTPDPMSPHPVENQDNQKDTAATEGSPIASPPSTPLSIPLEDSQLIPSISVLRRRTLSRTGFVKDKDTAKEDVRCNTPDQPEVQPFDRRSFPLDEHMYEDMLKSMPEDHQQMRTNVQAQDTHYDYDSTSGGYIDSKMCSPGSESTESALADEDPNDPEWIDVERMSRDRHKR